MSEWISVDERLPEKNTKVLCYFKYEPKSPDVICENFYYGSGRWMCESSKVTYWMQLPGPPKEAEKNHHLYSNVAPKPGGPFSLYCESCKCWVPNTANAEMRKEGLYAHSHWCKDGLCDMRNGEIKEATP